MTTAIETTQKSAADYLDEHFFSLASGGEGDAAFSQLLEALNFDERTEVKRATTVLSLMAAAKDRHALADKLEELQRSKVLKNAKAAVQAAREEAEQCKKELDAAYEKLEAAEEEPNDNNVDEIESLRATANELKTTFPDRIKAIRQKELAAQSTRYEIEQQIDEVTRALQLANEAYDRLASTELLPLHIRKKASSPKATQHHAKRVEIECLIAKGQALLRFCDPSLRYTNNSQPACESIDDFLAITGLSTINSSHLWKRPEQYGDLDWQVIGSDETFATLRAHTTAELSRLRSDLRSVMRQIEAGNAECLEGSTYYQDKL